MIYVVLLIVILVLGALIGPQKNDSKRALYLTLCFSIFAFVAGFRGEDVGIDTPSYLLKYDLLKGYNFSDYSYIWDTDPGFFGLIHIIHSTYDNPQVLFVICAIIISVAFGYFIYDSKQDVVISTMLFYLFLFPRTLNICRQYVAISFFVMALIFAFKRKKVPLIVFTILMFLFHQSSVIVLPFILIAYYYNRMTTKAILYTLVAPLILMILGDSFLGSIVGTKYLHYLSDSAQWENELSWKYVAIYMIYIIWGGITMASKSFKYLAEIEQKKMVLIYVLFVFSVVFYVAGTRLWILNRLSIISILPLF